jgi:hypothetical protein
MLRNPERDCSPRPGFCAPDSGRGCWLGAGGVTVQEEGTAGAIGRGVAIWPGEGAAAAAGGPDEECGGVPPALAFFTALALTCLLQKGWVKESVIGLLPH